MKSAILFPLQIFDGGDTAVDFVSCQLRHEQKFAMDTSLGLGLLIAIPNPTNLPLSVTAGIIIVSADLISTTVVTSK